jgi:DNA invertase Pin-like site-specific DNA recombinase
MSNAPQSQPVLAVGYVRRSTDKQEASIEDQTAAVAAFAADRGYAVLRWYTDDGVSGDDTERRHGFQRMLADAQARRDFGVIICWDQSRFGRFTPQEAGHWTYLFSRAGVGLVTVDKGPVDWDDFTGWLTYSVNQHSKHDFLQQLSKDVCRGQAEAAKAGSWLGQPPYGYRVEGGRKTKRLVVDDATKVRVVQRVFREFVEEGRSLSDIARRLHADGYPTPGARGRPWRYDSVRTILSNPAYCGVYASGRYSYGKFNTIRGGQVTKGGGRKVGRKAARNPEAAWTVRRDNHEPMVDADTFERARALLERWKTGRGPHTPETSPFALAGLLRCGRCGCPMWGDTVKARRFYRCGTWQTHGPDACEGTKVAEETILGGVADHLETWLGLDAERVGGAAFYGTLTAGDLPEGFDRVRKLVMPPAAPKADRARLARRAGELAAKVAKARGNLPFLDRENLPAAQDAVRKLEDERAAAEEELRRTEPAAEADVNAAALRVLDNLYGLAYACRSLSLPGHVDAKGNRGVGHGDGTVTVGSLETAAPRAVRRFLSHTSHIVVHSEKHGTGRGTRHRFAGGEIVFNGVGAATGKVNLHDRAS